MRSLLRNLSVSVLLFSALACGDGASEVPVVVSEAAPAAAVTTRLVGVAPSDSAIVFQPAVAGEPLPVEGPAYLGQSASTFQPSLLVVRRGQPVEFSNDEEVIHNVHVTDAAGETVFNVTTLFFSTYTHVFDEAGVYDVACGIHPVMRATLVVTDAPYSTVSDADGRFEISLPPGAYEVAVLGSDPALRSRVQIEVAGERQELSLN